MSEALLAIVDRITNNTHTDADLLILRQMLSGAIATGEQSLAISGDANGATITTGDGNIILNITDTVGECATGTTGTRESDLS